MNVLDPTALTDIKQGWFAYSSEDGRAYLITPDGAIPATDARIATELDDGLLVRMGVDWFRLVEGGIGWTKPASPVPVGDNGFEGRMSGYHFGGVGTYLAGPTGMVSFSERQELIDALKIHGGWFWDFTQESTLQQDSAGTIPVTTADQPIGRIVDLAQGLPLTQVSAASKPIWKGEAGAFFDGTNDWMTTAASLDFSATDKMTVVAGLRKLGSGSSGTVVEFTENLNTNDGSFWLAAPQSDRSFAYYQRGTTMSVAARPSAPNDPYPSPVNVVLSAEGDIAAPLVELYVDGVSRWSNAASQGGGVFANAPLYVGRRGGSSLAYSGYITGLCIIPTIDARIRMLAESTLLALNKGLPA